MESFLISSFAMLVQRKGGRGIDEYPPALLNDIKHELVSHFMSTNLIGVLTMKQLPPKADIKSDNLPFT